MVQVFVGIGSNIERKKHIKAAVETLGQRFTNLQLSSVYESEAVGFDGYPFYNLVAGFSTQLSVNALARFLRKIEYTHGRKLCEPKYNNRKLDIDLLTYGKLVGTVEGHFLPRRDITAFAHVLRPLAEIAPTERHPELDQNYQQLWHGYDKLKQSLSLVKLSSEHPDAH